LTGHSIPLLGQIFNISALRTKNAEVRAARVDSARTLQQSCDGKKLCVVRDSVSRV